LDTIAASDESIWRLAQAGKTLAILKLVHLKIQGTAVRNVSLTEEDVSELLAQLAVAKRADPYNEQVHIMEAETLNSAGTSSLSHFIHILF
jgi:hypothetical protein